MGFGFKNILRRVTRTVKAQVQGQITGFVGRSVLNAAGKVTGKLETKAGSALNSLKNKAVGAGVRARRAGLLSNAGSVARGTIARAKGEKIVDNFKL
jgi:hypothetical protein